MMDAAGIALVLGAVTALLVTAIGPGIRWYFQRRDARTAAASALTKAELEKAEALKTVASLEQAVTTKNGEIASKDQRIAHLETLLTRRMEGAG